MKKTNFWKSVAMAAVALVSVFATSCSEEELKIEGVDPNHPELVLPDAKASVSISVVDLENGTTISVTNIDATSSIGSNMTIECPANDGYTVAKPVTVAIPSIEKGQAIVIPVTFYVVTTESAFADLNIQIDYENVNYDYVEEHELTFVDTNGWVDGVYTNETYQDVESILVCDNYYTGVKFETVESRAAETTVVDLLNLHLIFNVGQYKELDVIPARTKFIHNKVYQKIHITNGAILNDEGEAVVAFQTLVAGAVVREYALETIPEPEHGHGHGHGHGNSNNAGGGIGENVGE